MKHPRKQLCPCGSGKKLKHCCMRFPDSADPLSPSLTLRHRNILLLNAIADILDLGNKKFRWEDFRKNISEAHVAAVYEAVADLFPPGLDVFTLFPQPTKRLRALYLGDVTPENITRNVCRFGLYADEIFVVNPFINPWGMAPGLSPLDNPNKYKTDTLKVLFFIARLYRWILSGVVTLIPNPCEYDWRFRETAFAIARERMKRNPPTDADLDDGPDFLAEIDRQVLLTPAPALRAMIKEKYPEKSDDEIDYIIRISARRKELDPVVLLQDAAEIGNQIVISRGGTTLETAFHLCDLTGSFPYTTIRRVWNDILSKDEDMTETERIWSPLTRAFQELDFKFLDNVDSEFAFSIRDDGRLHGFRAFLGQVWSAIKGTPDPMKAESLARDFADQLRQKYREAEEEWKRIGRDAYKWGGGVGVAGLVTTGIMSLHAAFPVPTGGLAGTIGAVTTLAASGAVEGFKRHWERDKFRATVPMSVFVDLSRHRPSAI